MRSVIQTTNATPFGPNNGTMQLFRVIGTVDIDGQGTEHEIAQVDPFLFLDDAIIEGELPTAFKKHPHTGLTAVTYLLEGTARAWDNLHGDAPDLNRAGGVYCVAAGKGIVHGEVPAQGMRRLRILQMWYNPGIYRSPLPEACYQLFQPDELPVYENDTLWAKVIIGTGFNLTSPVASDWPIQYLHIKLGAKQIHHFIIPNENWQGFIYIISGKGKFGVNENIGISQQCLILGLEEATRIPIENMDDTPLEFILATGKPHHKTFVKLLGHGGAIVADSEAHARAAMRQYEADPEHFGAPHQDHIENTSN